MTGYNAGADQQTAIMTEVNKAYNLDHLMPANQQQLQNLRNQGYYI